MEQELAEGSIAADELRLLIERIERLEEEKKAIADDVRDVYGEAKARGYDPKTMRAVVRLQEDGNPLPPGSRGAARHLQGGAGPRLIEGVRRRPARPTSEDRKMAGHSKFKNIMYRKGAQDKKRSAMFSKLAREITVAAKMGLPDPDANPRLRAAVTAARAQSMPKDNIQRAIDKAIGGDAENYEEIRYEGFGPGGVSLVVEALTDNRNRTATNVRTIFSKNGGNLGASGSVTHGFERLGLIAYPAAAGCGRQGVRGGDRGRRRGRRIRRGRPSDLDRAGGSARSRARCSSRRWARRRASSSPGARRPRSRWPSDGGRAADQAGRGARGG